MHERTPTDGTKVPITRRALLARLRRHLADDGDRKLITTPRSGHFFVVVGDRVEVADVDPIALAAERGILKPWEVVS